MALPLVEGGAELQAGLVVVRGVQGHRWGCCCWKRGRAAGGAGGELHVVLLLVEGGAELQTGLLLAEGVQDDRYVGLAVRPCVGDGVQALRRC